jgi:hypothetical protein
MKSIGEIKNKLANLNEVDTRKAIELSKEFKNFTEKKAISSEGLKHLYNIQTQLVMFIEQYSDRLVTLLKQNHMVD